MPSATGSPSALVLRDRSLVDSCVAGDPSAWSKLYQSHHDSLVSSIREFLGRFASDPNLVDEIAARVWYALVRNDFQLLSRFDVSRGCRLTTFLSVLAKAEARLLLRSERRRRTREQVASRSESNNAVTSVATENISEQEFIATLSPMERRFYREVLTATDRQPAADRFSRQNVWQLRHRVRKKLERFFGE